MLAAVLFDLDCTLVDRVRSIRQYAARFASDFRDRLASDSLEHIAEVIIAADGWGYRPATRYHDMVAHLTWQTPPVPEEVATHWSTYFPSMAVAMDGAHDVLETLQTLGMSLGLITNGTIRVQEQKLDVLGLRPYFRTIVISEAVGVKKPHAAIFQHALDGLGVSAEQAWFVGDHPENDMIGASQAGLRTVWLQGSHAWPASHPVPHHQIGSLRELMPLLKSVSR